LTIIKDMVNESDAISGIEAKERDCCPNSASSSPIQRITSKEIDIPSILKSIDDNSVGAKVLFIGTVRNFSDNGNVAGMTYEAYVGMAEDKIKNIEIDAKKTWGVKKISIIHRIGDLTIGDNSVAIAISSPHSKDAFAACQFVLDKIKREVPIWKKEKILGGGTKWVEGKSIRK
jgi:molybdopterin synthase catalytic subunit